VAVSSTRVWSKSRWSSERPSGEIGRRAYKWLYDRILSRTYDVAVRWWSLPFGGEHRFRRALLDPVSFAEGERILDLCCGTGGATAAIRERAGAGSDVIGLDLSEGQLRSARKRRGSGLRFVEGNAERTAFADAAFDRVFVSHALHELPREARRRVLREARRLLRSGGMVALLDLDDPPSRWTRAWVGGWFLYWVPFNFETPTRRDLFRSGLDREVAAAGFRGVTKVGKYSGIFQVVQGVKP
jgi:demethylmenaquinone methyltransferase/2-methoxy-6-polyprenyl-1,4-benzoquinol methylase